MINLTLWQYFILDIIDWFFKLQMGFGGMEDMDAMVYGGDDDDDDLEAELAALTGDVSESKKVSPKKKG